ncbi:MAG TPA: hypothetical protein VLA04_00285 [Verrucomicrobiae bacterium]|nr:hypothetical protein [Verrucomicrobiae bacterium]
MTSAKKKETKEPVFSARRTTAIFVVAFAILWLLGYQVFAAIRPQLAERYTNRGVEYLKTQNFPAAAREFRRAQELKSPDAERWLTLAESAPTDPRELDGFWRESHIDPVVRLLDESGGPFTSPKAAVTAAIRLYETGEPEYAQYALEKALEADPDYPEAWHYRYLTYEKLAAENAKYRKMAEEARQKRDQLTSLYLNP